MPIIPTKTKKFPFLPPLHFFKGRGMGDGFQTKKPPQARAFLLQYQRDIFDVQRYYINHLNIFPTINPLISSTCPPTDGGEGAGGGFNVAGPGVEPGLWDYEPHVQPYTTPHVSNFGSLPQSCPFKQPLSDTSLREAKLTTCLPAGRSNLVRDRHGLRPRDDVYYWLFISTQ